MVGLRANPNTTASDTIHYGLLGPRVENPLMVNRKFGHFLITIKGFCALGAINHVYTQSERIERRGHPHSVIACHSGWPPRAAGAPDPSLQHQT